MTERIFHGRVRCMEYGDLEQVLDWRNHPEVRKYMYTQCEIGMLEHQAWFDRESNNQKRHLLIYEVDGQPRGFVNISESIKGHVADWGFYLAPQTARGSGRSLGIAALDFAFTNLKLHKLCGQVLDYNLGSIKFHLRMGFQQEGALREQHFDGQTYHTVIHFGLLRHEWQALNENY
ncbi:MAG: UDP-4-amino-4,6-dideoxy-N-acetyl-beta-L-altrosamine N-acetyltransferase [Pseudomonas palmensis]|uniref:UDP-4-amino-4, 6-dideoxy-N-acetyl-beta-L-altrosamine N-acetyltransferase n=1 Tax=Pseudomonas palmensis TaxID=2815362 RepID=UPI003D1047D2